MIQTIMLVTLGFLLACLLGLMIGPVFRRHAAKIAVDRLKASTPVSLEDFRAEKDQMRADHALRRRRLELMLEKAKEDASQQLVTLSRQKTEARGLNAKIRELRTAMAERKSMNTVLEKTVKSQIPLLEGKLSEAESALEATHRQLGEARIQITALTDKLDQAARTETLHQAEIQRLRMSISQQPASLGVTGQPDDAPPHQDYDQLANRYAILRNELEKQRALSVREIPMLKQQLQELGSFILRTSASVETKAGIAEKLGRPNPSKPNKSGSFFGRKKKITAKNAKPGKAANGRAPQREPVTVTPVDADRTATPGKKSGDRDRARAGEPATPTAREDSLSNRLKKVAQAD